jgi:hypothetical protein
MFFYSIGTMTICSSPDLLVLSRLELADHSLAAIGGSAIKLTPSP